MIRDYQILWVVVPPVLAIGLWLLYNQWINGTWYPNTYLVKHDASLPILPLPNIHRLWEAAMVPVQPWLQGWLLFVTITMYLVGAYVSLRRGGATFLPLLLFPLLLLVAAGQGPRYPEGELGFYDRRYVDPATPVTLLVLAVGYWSIFSALLRASNKTPRKEKSQSLPPGRGKVRACPEPAEGMGLKPLARVTSTLTNFSPEKIAGRSARGYHGAG